MTRPNLDDMQRAQREFIGPPQHPQPPKMERRLTREQERELDEQIDLRKWELGL